MAAVCGARSGAAQPASKAADAMTAKRNSRMDCLPRERQEILSEDMLARWAGSSRLSAEFVRSLKGKAQGGGPRPGGKGDRRQQICGQQQQMGLGREAGGRRVHATHAENQDRHIKWH